jgi:hypothetical protein
MSMTMVNTVLGNDVATTLDEPGGISLISTSVASGITLGSGGYADSLTIASTGTVGGNDYRYDISGSGTVVNYGILEGMPFGGDGIDLANGTIINRGTILGGGRLTNATLINSGYISGGFTGLYVQNALIIDSGVIEAPEVPAISARYGLTLVLEPGFEIHGIAGASVASANGTLIASAGIQSLPLYGFVGFSKIDVSADPGITLNASHGWFEEDERSDSTLTGFQPGDTLQVSYAASYVPGEGIVVAGDNGATATIALGTIPADGLAFTTVSNTAGSYVDITAPCFCAGTRIRTPWGEVPVEALRIGDAVETAFAGIQRIKWIGRRSYEGRFIAGNPQALPVCIKAGAIADNIPARDLFVSPDHAICEAGVLIHAGRLVNGVSIVQDEAVAQVSYFHIELEGHHIVFAEACPTESFLNADCRWRFANAHDDAALYRETEQGKPCLPLVQSGFHLENIRRRLAARAGLSSPARPPGPLRGHLDEAGPARLRGWAQDVSAPELPVILTVSADGKPFTLVLANEFRTDLRAAGLGSGCHAFSLPVPPGSQHVAIHRASDGAELAQALLTQAA